jgi:thymidylate kinase
MNRVRDAYLDRARAAPDRIRLIDAAGPRETVRHHLATTLDEWLAQHAPEAGGGHE